MHVLVCGGAGYIGAHMVRRLGAEGIRVTVFDDFSTGHRAAVEGTNVLEGMEVVEGDVLDAAALDRAFAGRRFDAVMHFCAKSLVGESMRQPNLYYANNVGGTLQLLEAMRRHGVDRLVFSSTAAVFGNPVQDLIGEDHPTAPINPYGRSKLMAEALLADAAAAYGLRSVALRYFNAAGASADGGIGESHSPETHLVPNILRAAMGTGPRLQVFGQDYPTPDGTCVRDYVHVDDLADAHLRALAHMATTPGAHAFNLGNGAGFSVLEVIAAARAVTGRDIPFDLAPRRPGDPARLVAGSDRAREVLGWQPRHPEIAGIVESAWRWHQAPRY